MGTIRQRIIALIEQEPMDVVSISRALSIREKETLIHLPHIAKSIAGRGGQLQIRPAQCEACGYEFKDRRRLSPPSRCPRCKTSRIIGPWYGVSFNSSNR